MFSKRFVAASAVAVTSFATIAGEPPASLKAADPAAQVSQTTYTSVLSTYRPAEDTRVSPDKVWKEANATVANEDMHGDAHSDPAAEVQHASGHAGHTMPAQSAHPDARAGLGAPAEQAGQGAHAGHQMGQEKKPAKAIPSAPASDAGNSSHGQHQQHQEEEGTKK